MRWALSTVTTGRSWLISFSVRVLGTSTSMPDWRMGAVIMKMMSSTRTTSTKGTMLISESEVCVDLESCGIYCDFTNATGLGRPQKRLAKGFLDHHGYFQRKSVQALREIADILQKMVVENNGRDCRAQSCGGGNKRFGDAGRDGAQTGGAGAA